MERKHTKGEWAWQKFGSFYSLTAQHGFREIIISASQDEKNGLIYTSMNNDGILYPIDPNHPNAKLIAAAPELFEACIKMIEHYDRYLLSQNDVYEEMKKAINKATL